ncbi:MAG: IPExxxVDY family protein [Pedobacter sp.]|nr:MAG: IPExxxVDY family protein [Pedobacter sp.]
MNKTYLKLSLDLDLDFVLIAITASLKDYTLGHKINKILNFDFVRIEDHEAYFNIDEEPLEFSRFHYFIEEGEVDFFLVSNRNREGFLIPEMKKVDYFMIIQQYISKEDLREILAKLKLIPEVQVAAQIDPHKLKSKENLIM